ncbi:hypothetical protein HK099_000401 [Clydaea vesicula]|uniref:Peptidase S8/S53 domain-containing protein n=1 Tax=Clydaea vesicula TaxID=447962 RepID=A0AAD5XWJ1_9FUNG|nr:hypothetical protein HK099_000401 [Clydaea vesicula]
MLRLLFFVLLTTVLCLPKIVSENQDHGYYIVKVKNHGGLEKRDSLVDISFAEEIIKNDNKNILKIENEEVEIKKNNNFNDDEEKKLKKTVINQSKILHYYKDLPNFQSLAVFVSNKGYQAFESNPNVEYIQRSTNLKLFGTQFDPWWNLNRIDQVDLPYDNKYTYPEQAGLGITVYVLDTGILSDHPEFEGRASEGLSFVNGTISAGAKDLNGHGTHCAGVVASKTYGVAKNATVVGLQVVDQDGKGNDVGLITALNWVAANAIPGKSVVSVSLGSDIKTCVKVARPDHPEDQECNSKAVRDAVSSVVKLNIPVVVAAGNDAMDACEVSPSSEPSAFTVTSSTSSDILSDYSNYGSCVDMIAPGDFIASPYLDNEVVILSGTSMACPHVSGAFAILLSQSNYTSVDLLYKELSSKSTKNKFSFPAPKNTTINNLLFI